MFEIIKQKRFSISNILAIICIIATFVWVFMEPIIPQLRLFSINNFYWLLGRYDLVFVQLFTGTFFHAGLFHLLTNMIFLVYFGNIVEQIMGTRKYLLFFLFTAIFEGIAIIFLSSGITVGISGFCMAILAYYALGLYYSKNPEYKGAFGFLILNVLIGLSSGISFIGHFFGAMAGFIFFIITDLIIKSKKI